MYDDVVAEVEERQRAAFSTSEIAPHRLLRMGREPLALGCATEREWQCLSFSLVLFISCTGALSHGSVSSRPQRLRGEEFKDFSSRPHRSDEDGSGSGSPPFFFVVANGAPTPSQPAATAVGAAYHSSAICWELERASSSHYHQKPSQGGDGGGG